MHEGELHGPPDLVSGAFLESLHHHESRLLCAVCGYDYVHIERVDVDQGDAGFVVADRTCVVLEKKHDNKKWSNGSEARIFFWCESGHKFSLAFNFHKGMTYVSSRDGGEVDDERSTTELPRD